MLYSNPGAAVAPTTFDNPWTQTLRRLIIVIVAVALAITMVAIEAPPPSYGKTKAKRTEAQRIVRYARSHLGARFRIGTEGNRYFDCSGLVYRVYKQAHLLRKIGGTRLRAAGYYRYFKRHHRVSRRNPKPGDLVWWKKRGRIEHMGIWIGHGRALSALTTGVRTHRLRSINVRFLAFGHVNLKRR